MKQTLVSPKNKSILVTCLLGIFWTFILFLLVVCGIRGIVYSDEGYILSSAERIFNGQIPYKDFHFAYTPLTVYLTTGAFMFFGKSILAGRILMILVSLVTSIILFFLFQKITKNLFITCVGVLLYIIWGPLHSNFPWPVLFSISFGIVSLFLFLSGRERKKPSYIFLSGLFTAFVLLTKQNFGVVLLLNFGFAFLFTLKQKKWDIIRIFLLGWLTPVVLYTLLLFFTGSLQAFIEDFYRYTIQRIILEQTLNTPFLYGNSFLEKSAKFFFYTAPLLLSICACIVSFLRNRTFFFLSSFVLLFYMVGIRPTTDYIHLSPLLSLIGIPLVICWKLIEKRTIKIALGIIALVFITLGAYSAWFIGYYRWEPSLSLQTAYIDLPKTYISSDSFHKNELEKLKKMVQAKTQKNDFIFVDGYMPMLYFVLDRKNPTSFDLLEPTKFYEKDEKHITALLQKTHTKLVITNGQVAKNYLGEYIKKEYNRASRVNGFIIWEKK